MSDTPEFQQKQFAFAAHIRDPEGHAPPAGIEDRRMAIYRELFFNNLHKLISSTFPVLRKLHSNSRWNELIREFMVRHRAQTPYFLEIPKEFLNFLDEEHAASDDFPFLRELAHYEWAELALSISEEQDDMTRIDPDGDLLLGVPVKSVLAWSLAYQYPVHRISTTYKPTEPGDQPTFLAVWRKPDDELGFMELNPLTARLIDVVDGNDDAKAGRDLLRELATELNFADANGFLAYGLQALEDLRAAGIVIGTRRAVAAAT